MGCPPPGGSDPEQKAIVIPQVSAGAEHSMILKTDGTLWAVGRNDSGQLGDGSTTNQKTPVQVMIAAGNPMTDVAQVSVGIDHTLILKKNGSLWAVGKNDFGQLGDGSTTNQKTPVQVMIAAGNPMADVAQVSAGYQHSMIVVKNGTLWAVGHNKYGQLGDGTKTNRSNPVQVRTAASQPITNVAQVSAGYQHTMILKTDDTLWGVGRNNVGQLGDGSTTDQKTPVQVRTAASQPITNVAQVSVGFEHSMIVVKNGTLWAVGYNKYGQLGNSSYDNPQNPVKVMNGVTQVSAGTYHTMIVKTDSTLWAVGKNVYGQLGDGSTTNQKTPVQVMEIPAEGEPPRVMTNVVQVSASRDHTLIVKTDDSLWAVGKNEYGQLGTGDSGSDAVELIPVEITVE